MEPSLYSPAMSDEAELDELARRYLDLWQDQMSALAADPAYAEALGRLLGAMGLADPAAGGKADDGKGAREGGDEPGSGAAGTSAAAAAPHAGGPDLEFLLRRLAALEKRVAALESGTPRARGGAKGKARQTRS